MRPPAASPTAAPRAAAQASRPALWTPAFVLVLAMVHVYFASYFLMLAALPLYVTKSPKWQVGLVVGVPFIASVLVRPLSGRLADRIGRRRLLIAGSLGCAATTAAQALSADVAYLVVVRLGYGVASALLTTAILAALADVLPAARRGTGMGWYGIVYTSTNLYAPALGLWIAQSQSYTAFFAFGALLNLICAALAFLFVEQVRPAAETTAGVGRLFSRVALLPMQTFLTLTLTAGTVSAFLSLYEKQRHAGDPGAFFVLYGVTLMVGRVLAGLVADHRSRPSAILPGLVVTACAMLLLATAREAAVFYVAAALYGLGFAFGHTGLTILTMDRAPAAERGAAMATLTAAWDLGSVLGAFVLGFLADAAGYPAVFALVGAVPLVQAGILPVLLRRKL